MKFCPKCGKELLDNTKVCPYCNGILDDSAKDGFEVPGEHEPGRLKESKFWPILALIFAIFGGFLGIVFSFIGLRKCKEKTNRTILSIALIISFLWLAIWFGDL